MAEAVMEELGVERDRVMKVFNKTDLLPEDEPRNGEGLWVSAVTGEGIPALKTELARRFGFEASSRELPREAAPGLF